MQAARRDIERLLRSHVADHPAWRRLAADAPDTFTGVASLLLGPGKRLRPALFLVAAEGYGFQPLPALGPVAVALELAHAFVLVHDDLLDRSATRRRQPSLQARLDARFEERPPEGFHGADAALVAGDLLYTLATECLADADAPPAARLAALRLFINEAATTARGALREMELARRTPDAIAPEEVLEVYRLKTAWYTFRLPLELAALFAGRLPAVQPAITAFAAPAGEAYQLLNDCRVLEHWLAGGPVPDDIRDRRRTPALLRAWTLATPAQQEQILHAPPADLAAVLRDLDVCPWLHTRIDDCRQRALAHLPALKLGPDATARIAPLLHG